MNKYSKALQKLAEDKESRKQANEMPMQRSAQKRASAEEIAETFSSMEQLGHMPVVNRISIEKPQIDPAVVSLHNPRSNVSEQYRTLRTNLRTYNRKGMKVFLISSSIEGEGKTMTALNLAFTLAQDRATRVLLIDADLRRSMVSTYLGIKKKRFGFTDVVSGKIGFDEGVVHTPLINLHIMPGRTDNTLSNAAELLGSHTMAKIVARARDEYDYVIIDSPPVIPVTDASVLAEMVDGVLLVFRAEKTQKNTIRHAESMFQQVNANVLGYVMTHVEYFSPGNKEYYYYNYSYN